MTRLWTGGAELQTVTIGIEFTAVIANAPAIETTTKRSGNAAYRINNASGAEGFRQQHTSSQGLFYFRFYLYIVALPTNTRVIGGSRQTGSLKAVIRLTSGGALQLYNFEDSAQIGSNSSALSTGQWYRIEMSYDSTTLSATACEAKIDGVTFASGNADFTATPNSLGCFTDFGDATLDYIVDDCAINDSTGSFQNSWPGEGEVIVLMPDNNGDNSQWTGSDGNSTNNYQLVDEVPPSSTDYVESNTSGQIDDYNLQATPAAMDSNDIINVVHVGVYAAVSDATGSDPDIVLRIKASASGTVEESASLDVNSITYHGPAPLPASDNYQLTTYDLPGASTTPWTKADLDTMQVGIREAVTDTHFARVATIWAMIDHKPNTGVSADITESATAADSPSAAADFAPAQSESGSATDLPSAVATFVPEQSEALSAADTVSAIMTTAAEQSEPVSAADTASALATFAADQSESASATDSPSALAEMVAAQAESATAQDEPSAIMTTDADQSESISAIDIVAAVGEFPVSIAESITALDSMDAVIVTAVDITESANAQDTSNGIFAGDNEVIEAASAQDLVSVVIVTAAGVLEEASAADLFSAVLTLPVSVLEPANADDLASGAGLMVASITESATALDVQSATGGSFATRRRNRQLLPLDNTMSPLGMSK